MHGMSWGHQFPVPPGQQRQSPFHAKVKVNCWSSLHRSLICPPQDQQRWLPFHMKVKVDCWSSPCQLSIPSGSTVLIGSTLIVNHLYVDHGSPLCQSLIPQDQQCWSPPHQSPPHQLPLHWSLIATTSIIDPPRSTVLIISMLIVDHLHINCWLIYYCYPNNPPIRSMVSFMGQDQLGKLGKLATIAQILKEF